MATKTYANKHHLVSLPTKHVTAMLAVLEQVLDDECSSVEFANPAEIEAVDQVRNVLQIEAESAELDMSVRCDQCGEWTGLDTGVCGECAEDFNTNPPHVGRKRINRRRRKNGLDLIVWEES